MEGAVKISSGGSYNCRLCGVPEKGHKCSKNTESNYLDLPIELLREIVDRLPLKALSLVGMVSRTWKEASKESFKALTELRVRPSDAGFFSGRCKSPHLVALSISLQSVMDVHSLLIYVVSRYEKLKSLELFDCQQLLNTDDLDDGVAYNLPLTSLKMEGLSNLTSFTINSDTILTLWLSGLHSLSHMALLFPNILDITLLFSQEENGTMDLDSLMDSLGKNCPKLVSIFISSSRLSHDTVLSLTAANLRELRLLALINGSDINDASVEAICKSYTNLELLDLSGSSITNVGIAKICELLSNTLTTLRVAACPIISLSGIITHACLKLYKLEALDCAYSTNDLPEECGFYIVHEVLKRLSLFGCINLVRLTVRCANLIDLNLKECTKLDICDLSKCPKLDIVYVAGCQDILVENVQTQLSKLEMETVVARSEVALH